MPEPGMLGESIKRKAVAKAAPGSVGSVTCRPPPPLLPDGDVRTVPPPLRVLRTLGTQGR